MSDDEDTAVAAMVRRITGEKQRSYHHGYDDGRAWGLVHATRTDLYVARQLKVYDGDQLVTDGEAGFGPYGDLEFSYPAGVPEMDIPGLPANLEVFQYEDQAGARFSGVYDHLKAHLGPGEEGNVEAYAEGWRDALSDLYGTLLDAEKTGGRD